MPPVLLGPPTASTRPADNTTRRRETYTLGVASLVADDHLGAATPADAYVVGPFVMALGLAMAGFAALAYRKDRSH